MELNPDVKNALFAVGGTVGGGVIVAAILAIPGLWKGWKKEIGDEALHRDAELKLSIEVGVQKQQITDLAGDLHGVAEMVRKRFDDLGKSLDRRFAKLKEKDIALETLVTQELPKFEDTDERPSGEQPAVTDE